MCDFLYNNSLHDHFQLGFRVHHSMETVWLKLQIISKPHGMKVLSL